METHSTRLNHINGLRDIQQSATTHTPSVNECDDGLLKLVSVPAMNIEQQAEQSQPMNFGEDTPTMHATRNRPRMLFTQAQSILVMLILVSALAASLTLLVKQRLNYAHDQDTLALIDQMNGSADADSPSGAQQQSTNPDSHNSEPMNTEMNTEIDTDQSGDESKDAETNEAPDEENPVEEESASADGERADGRVNINTATAVELMTLDGVGPVTAEKILQYRASNGQFRSVDELLEVKGIGAKTLEKLRPQVRVQ